MGSPKLSVYRCSVPIIENVGLCPQEQALWWRGGITANVRLSLATFWCSYSFDSMRWNCTGGVQAHKEDLKSFRATFGGYTDLSRTTLHDLQ